MPYAHGPSVKKLSKMATLLLGRNYILMLTRTVEHLRRLLAEAYSPPAAIAALAAAKHPRSAVGPPASSPYTCLSATGRSPASCAPGIWYTRSSHHSHGRCRFRTPRGSGCGFSAPFGSTVASGAWDERSRQP